MKRTGTLLLALFLGVCFAPRCVATVHHSNGSALSVQALHAIAQDGDTITLPAGTFTWLTGVRLTKPITLQGATAGSTIIRDDIQSGGIISWNLRGTTNGAARITGIKFQNGGRINTAWSPGGLIHFNGSNTNGTTLRVDHCGFVNLNGVIVFDTVIGVVDHNTLTTSRGGSVSFAILDSYWNNDSLGKGDQSYAAPSNFGRGDFLFFEDNIFTATSSSPPWLLDSYSAGRFVIRHNQIVFMKIAVHGTESTGRFRGFRAMEVYRNAFTAPSNPQTNGLGLIRSGVVIYHDNTFSGWSPQGQGTAIVILTDFRTIANFLYWPGADGTSGWDVNEPSAFYSGTASSASSGRTVTASGNPNWTTNRWINYTIRRTSNLCNSNSYTFGIITSNTANTITYRSGSGDPHDLPSLAFCAGDPLEIRKVDHALDQPGRARGSLITGIPPARPAGWNNQVTEPCYSWGNTDEHGGHVNFRGGGVIRAGEHFFNDTPMPGYTEYVYPHPLVSGAPMSQQTDFNNDGNADYVLYNPTTRQTVVWYMDNNVYVTGSSGPTLPDGWSLVSVADFNRDGHPDYLLFNPTTRQTVIWYLSGVAHISGNYGPTLPGGWELTATADFNGDGYPDLVLYNVGTHQTVVWYMHNNVHVTSSYGPTLPGGWSLVAVADFNGDGHPDYLLLNSSTGETVIWYLNGTTHTSGKYGPTLPAGWSLSGTADFDGNGGPDYLLYDSNTGLTTIWYMNNNVLIGAAVGPTLPGDWSLVAP
jgi:hypothetical protein